MVQQGLIVGEEYWAFAKGHVEEGEVIEEAARREIFEEVGLKGELIDGFTEKKIYEYKRGTLKDVSFFLMDATGQQEKKDEKEILDCRWFDFEKSKSMLTFDNLKDVLVKANDFIESL